MSHEERKRRLPECLDDGEPVRIGSYRLLEVLGQGSMGTVYLAEQEQPVRRQVALKVLTHDKGSDLIVARFATERQALAVMNHPCIATVYHAGTTDRGLPYLAMEVVRGEPITSFCNQHKLTVRQRLELFLDVCDAIHHAHQKMVIHRDIKPSNVLVSLDSGRPVPKVIDFGVAKSIDKRLGATPGAAGHDDSELPVGTPLYMSPEQVGGDGRITDTRADVYALGVLLYELLAGPLPFTAWTAEIPQLLVRLLEYSPPPPSERIKKQVGSSGVEQIAAARSISPRRLHRLLRGDLDRITMRAMEKDRNLRYGSVSELRSDVLRFLRNEPIMAIPPTLGYRLGKFLRRYRGPVVATVLVFLTLLGAIAAYSVGLVRARQARDTALAAQRRATATLEFLQSVLGSMDVGIDGHKVRVVDQLTRASQMVDQGLADTPEVEAEVRKSIGLALLELGIFDDAGHELERAEALQRELLGGDHPETLRTQHLIARLRCKLGRYEEAARTHRQVLDRQRQVLGEEDPRTLWTLYNLAKDLHKLGSWDEAESLFREAVAIRSRLLGADHPDTLVTINSLSILLSDRGTPGEAEQLQRANLRALERRIGANHADTLRARANLVEILNHQERWEEAAQLSRSTLDLLQRVMGEEHPETLGTRAQLALALDHLGSLQEAEELHRRVLEIRRMRLGEWHPDTLQSKVNLGVNLVLQGRTEEGEAFLLEGTRAARRLLPAGHWRIAQFVARYGRCLTVLQRYAEAEQLLLEAYEAERTRHPQRLAPTLEALADLYERWSRPEQARKYRRLLSANGATGRSQSPQ